MSGEAASVPFCSSAKSRHRICAAGVTLESRRYVSDGLFRGSQTFPQHMPPPHTHHQLLAEGPLGKPADDATVEKYQLLESFFSYFHLLFKNFYLCLGNSPISGVPPMLPGTPTGQ